MKSWTTTQLFGTAASVAVIAGLVGAGLTRPPAGMDITEPNSPLYGIAVTESVKGLNGEKKEPKQGEPCPDCGQIHAPVVVPQGNVAGTAGAASTNFFYCENCKAYHPVEPELQLELGIKN